jgi:hypothetical protein
MLERASYRFTGEAAILDPSQLEENVVLIRVGHKICVRGRDRWNLIEAFGVIDLSLYL